MNVLSFLIALNIYLSAGPSIISSSNLISSLQSPVILCGIVGNGFYPPLYISPPVVLVKISINWIKETRVIMPDWYGFIFNNIQNIINI